MVAPFFVGQEEGGISLFQEKMNVTHFIQLLN
jgi:hypothetical protein